MTRDGNDTRRLSSGGYDVAAAWSPDGRQILFTKIIPFANSERGLVVVMSAGGTKRQTLTRGTRDEHATSWQSLR